MGPTKVMKTRYTDPNTIRGMFGLSDTRNCSHGSDSLETAEREMKFFFPNFNISDFNGSLEEEEILKKFSDNVLDLDKTNFVHFC